MKPYFNVAAADQVEATARDLYNRVTEAVLPAFDTYSLADVATNLLATYGTFDVTDQDILELVMFVTYACKKEYDVRSDNQEGSGSDSSPADPFSEA